MTTTRSLLRYDTFGPVEQVLHDIDTHVPHIFPDHADNFVRALKMMVRHNSNQFGWQTVVLSVCRGMAADELEALLDAAPEHRGPVIVDPTLLTSQSHFYDKLNDLKSDKDRLAMLCQTTDDTLVTLYGVDGISHLKTMQFLQTRLRMLDNSFEMLKDDIRHDPRMTIEPQRTLADINRLELAKKHLRNVSLTLEANIRGNIDPDGNLLSSKLFRGLSELSNVPAEVYNPVLRHNLEAGALMLSYIPAQHYMLNVAYPVRPQPQAPAHTPSPHLAPIIEDEINPRPKMR